MTLRISFWFRLLLSGVFLFTQIAHAYYVHGTARVNGKDYQLLGDDPGRIDGIYLSRESGQPLFYADFGPFNVDRATLSYEGRELPVVRVFELFGPNPTEGFSSPSENSSSTAGSGSTFGGSSRGGFGGGTSGGTSGGLEIGGGYVYSGPPPSLVVGSVNRLIKGGYEGNSYKESLVKISELTTAYVNTNQVITQERIRFQRRTNEVKETEKLTHLLEHCVQSWLQRQAQGDPSLKLESLGPECVTAYRGALASAKDNLAQAANRQAAAAQPEYSPSKNDADYFGYLAQYPYRSYQSRELEKIRQKTLSHKASDLARYRAQTESLRALKEADRAYDANDERGGLFFSESGKMLADIATDGLPVAGTIKDLYRAWTGRDFSSGEKLTPTERAFAGVFAVADIISLGGTRFGRVPVAALARMAKASIGDIRVAQELLQTSQRLATQIHLLKPGTSGQYVIIGQRMGRVHKAANVIEESAVRLGKEGVKVHRFEATEAANRALSEMRKQFPEGKIPDEALRVTEVFQENLNWIRKMLDSDHTLIALEDISHKSVFFEMEIDEVVKSLSASATKAR